MPLPILAQDKTLHRYPLSEWLPYEAYDPEFGLYWLADRRWGRVWSSPPLLGLDDATLSKLTNLFEFNLPAGTAYQLALHASRDIRGILEAYREARAGQPEESQRWASRVVDYYTTALDQALIKTIKLPPRHLTCYLSVTIPGDPSPHSAAKIKEQMMALEQLVGSCGFALRPLHPTGLLRLLHQLLNPGHALEEEPPGYDAQVRLSRQAVRYDTVLQVREQALWLDRRVVVPLSVQQYAEQWHGSRNRNLIGSLMQQYDQITCPFWLCLNVVRLDHTKTSGTLTKKHVLISNQAFGALIKLVPIIGKKKTHFDEMMNQIAEGRQPLGVGFHLLCYGRSLEEAEEAAQTAHALYRTYEWLLQRDRYIGLHQFLHALPMACPGDAAELRTKLRRLKTVHSGVVPHLCPVVGDWQGLGRPVVLFTSRAGQLMAMDFFRNPTGNFNICVAAKSGSGKSFFANELIMNYLTVGGRIWMIDAGRSYQKLCEQLESRAQYIEFSKHAEQLSLNPFATLGERDMEGLAMLKSVVAQMMSPSRPLSDLEKSYLEEQITILLDRSGTDATVTELAAQLRGHADLRVKDLGMMLQSYTKDGLFGHYFHGGRRLSFEAPLIVLELDGLDSTPELRSVILLQLLLSIQQEMYLGDRSIYKICGMDEAWDLLSQGGNTAEFFEKGVRRVRKYNGAMLVITQGVNDFYDKMGQTGRALLENSDFVLLLMQKPESVEALRTSKRLSLSEYEFSLVNSLRRAGSEYSEIFFYSPVGRGIGRVVVDRFSQLLYTTNADELASIEAVKRELGGASTLAAIEELVRREHRQGSVSVRQSGTSDHGDIRGALKGPRAPN